MKAAVLLAARLAAPLALDGKLTEPAWRATADTGRFLEATTGKLVPPHTEARALWDADALYLGLYAADEDLRASDRFVIELGKARFEVDAAGKLHGAPPGVRAFADADGTLDDARDDDEEWQVELVIPWSALGLAKPPRELGLGISRTDQPKGSAPRTQAWRGIVRFRP